ncbi:MAG: sigma 54-interacting transcriptional regulator [Deltaproteobacteria bacterium]|nr:sigma 54-interacting transcriptional regulator [Deltaproteobacteria bacterium]
MGAKILVIDDEESIRFTFDTHLSNEGHEVFTSKDYPSAVDIIEKNNLDLIFADLILHNHTGIEILSKVKELGLNCPVIMMTGNPSIQTTTEAVRLGAFDYLLKPIYREPLLRATKIALDHKALIDLKKTVEEENERIRNNLEAIFRSVNDGIITFTRDMSVIEANDAVEKICNINPRELIGKKLPQVTKQCNNACENVLRETLKSQTTIRETRIDCGQLKDIHQVVSVTSSPLINKTNESIGAVLVVRDVTRLNDLENELRERHQFHNIIGKSSKMQGIYRLLEDLARTDTTVLITGESGTGKELIAKALHYSGPRSFKPMVTVNCSALAENLLESELFGHVKGAFTGALHNKVGRFQAADQGTIFLDEIGDIAQSVQLKLLRVIQEKELERVGDSHSMKVDVRIITSTNQPLKQKVEKGEFREDLYYRLKVVEIVLPPLRERREDIELLVIHFCDLFKKKFGKNIEGVTNDVLNAFILYPWPGNIRELEHAIEHAFVLCHENIITMDHIPSEIKEHRELPERPSRADEPDETRKITDALKQVEWNKARAARLLGISRQTLYRKIKERNIQEYAP